MNRVGRVRKRSAARAKLSNSATALGRRPYPDGFLGDSRSRTGAGHSKRSPRMIKLLRISNIALVSSAELELGPGLTLLTGETGAGKSILIDALGLVLGARASGDLIRTGADRAVVEAVVESNR